MTSILIVEDNVLLAATMERFLRDYGHMDKVTIAPSGEIALDQLRQSMVDLMLVDVALPGMSGIDLVAVIRNLYPHLPCLMLSGHYETEYVRRALDSGAKGYVLKNEPRSILTAIQQVLEGKTFVSEELRAKLYH
jgi:DNA-binding NarL/FixJ family response regulator